MEDSYLEDTGAAGGLGRPKSIWYNMQVQMHQSAGQVSAAAAASTLVLKQPSNWMELKLALSPPLSVRRFEKYNPAATRGTTRGTSRGGQLSRIGSPQLKKNTFTKSAPSLLKSQLSDFQNIGQDPPFSTFRGRSGGSAGGFGTLGNSHSTGSFKTLNEGFAGASRPMTPSQQQAAEGPGEGDLLVDENRGDPREVRIKMLADTLAPIIRSKTKVAAKEDFRRLLPSLLDAVKS